MPLPISYMGTKRQLSPLVREISEDSRPGPFLDLFSGMCAVASEVAPSRQIWTNDLQYFAEAVSFSHFCSKTMPPSRLDAVALVSRLYSKHVKFYSAILSDSIKKEHDFIKNQDYVSLQLFYNDWIERKKIPGNEDGLLERSKIFIELFSGSYFGISQSIEIDAIRYSIEQNYILGVIDRDTHGWLVLSLAVAVNKCSTSTGHFAQPLIPKKGNINRFSIQRLRSVWDCWMKSIETLAPVGSVSWRKRNKIFRGDAISCLELIKSKKKRPSVVYADPPYTNDQYSRYYHLYETLIRYDNPDAVGKGRYRSDREVSVFSLASKVNGAMEKLIQSCAGIEADMILSYPTNGLMKNSRDLIPKIMNECYGRYPDIREIPYEHSTMGGSKGPGKKSVTEVVYRVQF